MCLCVCTCSSAVLGEHHLFPKVVGCGAKGIWTRTEPKCQLCLTAACFSSESQPALSRMPQWYNPPWVHVGSVYQCLVGARRVALLTSTLETGHSQARYFILLFFLGRTLHFLLVCHHCESRPSQTRPGALRDLGSSKEWAVHTILSMQLFP